MSEDPQSSKGKGPEDPWFFLLISITVYEHFYFKVLFCYVGGHFNFLIKSRFIIVEDHRKIKGQCGSRARDHGLSQGLPFVHYTPCILNLACISCKVSLSLSQLLMECILVHDALLVRLTTIPLLIRQAGNPSLTTRQPNDP